MTLRTFDWSVAVERAQKIKDSLEEGAPAPVFTEVEGKPPLPENFRKLPREERSKILTELWGLPKGFGLTDINERLRKRRKHRAEGSDEPAFVYVFQVEKYFKIGVATNLKKRLSALLHGCPLEITQRIALPMPEGEAYRMEKELHKRFQAVRHRREWFCLTDEHLAEIESLRVEANPE